jgi:hypothetical protein
MRSQTEPKPPKGDAKAKPEFKTYYFEIFQQFNGDKQATDAYFKDNPDHEQMRKESDEEYKVFRASEAARRKEELEEERKVKEQERIVMRKRNEELDKLQLLYPDILRPELFNHDAQIKQKAEDDRKTKEKANKEAEAEELRVISEQKEAFHELKKNNESKIKEINEAKFNKMIKMNDPYIASFPTAYFSEGSSDTNNIIKQPSRLRQFFDSTRNKMARFFQKNVLSHTASKPQQQIDIVREHINLKKNMAEISKIKDAFYLTLLLMNKKTTYEELNYKKLLELPNEIKESLRIESQESLSKSSISDKSPLILYITKKFTMDEIINKLKLLQKMEESLETSKFNFSKLDYASTRRYRNLEKEGQPGYPSLLEMLDDRIYNRIDINSSELRRIYKGTLELVQFSEDCIMDFNRDVKVSEVSKLGTIFGSTTRALNNKFGYNPNLDLNEQMLSKKNVIPESEAESLSNTTVFTPIREITEEDEDEDSDDIENGLSGSGSEAETKTKEEFDFKKNIDYLSWQEYLKIQSIIKDGFLLDLTNESFSDNSDILNKIFTEFPNIRITKSEKSVSDLSLIGEYTIYTPKQVLDENNNPIEIDNEADFKKYYNTDGSFKDSSKKDEYMSNLQTKKVKIKIKGDKKFKDYLNELRLAEEFVIRTQNGNLEKDKNNENLGNAKITKNNFQGLVSNYEKIINDYRLTFNNFKNSLSILQSNKAKIEDPKFKEEFKKIFNKNVKEQLKNSNIVSIEISGDKIILYKLNDNLNLNEINNNLNQVDKIELLSLDKNQFSLNTIEFINEINNNSNNKSKTFLTVNKSRKLENDTFIDNFYLTFLSDQAIPLNDEFNITDL